MCPPQVISRTYVLQVLLFSFSLSFFFVCAHSVFPSPNIIIFLVIERDNLEFGKKERMTAQNVNCA